jgi:transcription termination factor NusB
MFLMDKLKNNAYKYLELSKDCNRIYKTKGKEALKRNLTEHYYSRGWTFSEGMSLTLENSEMVLEDLEVFKEIVDFVSKAKEHVKLYYDKDIECWTFKEN